MAEKQRQKRSIQERIFGAKLSTGQIIFAILYLLTISFWPKYALISIFLFDAPHLPLIAEIGRWAFLYLVLPYPVYYLPWLWFCFRLSNSKKKSYISFTLPFLPHLLMFCSIYIWSSDFSRSSSDTRTDSSQFLGDGYSLDNSHVLYRKEKMLMADFASFQVIEDGYAIDKNNVYFDGEIVSDADPKTFSYVKYYYGKDKNDYFYKNTPLHISDMQSVKQCGSWLVDRNYIYWQDGKTQVGDYDSFEVIEKSYYAKDKYQVYYKDTIITDADPVSFQAQKWYIGQDKNGVYLHARKTDVKDYSTLKGNKEKTFFTDQNGVYNAQLKAMPQETDFATLKKIEQHIPWSTDTNNVYWQTAIVKGANPNTFKPLPILRLSKGEVQRDNLYHWGNSKEYGKDDKHIYYHNEILKDADYATFQIFYDSEESTNDTNFLIVCDKNKYYQGTATKLLNKYLERQSKR